MKLLQSPTSPYARKVRMTIVEKGLSNRVTLEAANPAGPEAALIRAANPLGKVPCLVLDDGTALYDSPVICEYLDSLIPSPALIPASGAARWTVLRLQALADGVMDAAVNTRMEAFRKDGERSSDMVAHWRGGIVRGLEQLGREPHLNAAGFDLAQISTAAALGYIYFRLGDLAQSAMPKTLSNWWDKVQTRPSVRDTAPPG
jgi:glutathione S-transferase